MTKRREPFSAEEALCRIADRIGWSAVARIAGREERTVRQWSEHEEDRHCPQAVAVQLDIAWRAAGGAGLPFHDAHRHHLDAASAPVTCTITLPESFRDVLRECPQAKEAIFVVIADPGIADPTPAIREVDEAIASLMRARTALLTRSRQVVTLGPPP